MGTNKTIIFFLLLFFFKTVYSNCLLNNFEQLDFINNPPYISCSSDTDTIIFYPNLTTNEKIIPLTLKTYSSLPNQDSLNNAPPPTVYSFLPVETYGGYKDFIGFFFIKYYPNYPPDNFMWSISLDEEDIPKLKRRYIEETQQLIFSYNVSEGSCSFSFLGKSYSYQTATLGNPVYTLDSDGSLTINGNNLKDLTITTKDLLATKYNTTTKYTLNKNHTTATFSDPDFKYSGKYNITITQCNKSLDPFTVNILPDVLNFTTVPLKGGRLTLTGRYLSIRDNYYNSISINLIKEQKVTPCTNVIYQLINPGGVEIVTCSLPGENTQDENTPQTIKIDINGIKYIVPSSFVYDQPAITNIEYNGNSEIIIWCKNYINNLAYIKVMVPNGLGDNKGNSLRLGSFDVTNDTERSDANTNYGIFKATNIPHFAMPGFLTILFNGSNIESPIYNKFMLQPSVTGISNCKTQGGKISIYGSSLFIQDYKNKTIENSFIKINGKDCFQFENGDGSFITCDVAPGTGKQYSFSIILNGIEYNENNKLMFSYKPPSIDDFEQNFETNVISILGNNFGDEIGTAIVKFNNEYVNIKSITHIMITIDIKDSFSGNYTIHTLIGDTEHAQDQVIPFIGPVLPLIKNVSNVDCSGGIVTINGKNLNDKMQINFVATNTIGKKRKPTPCINVKLINSTYAECIVLGRSGQLGNSTTYTSGKNFNVTVENGKKDGNATLAIFSFNPPIIDKVYNFTGSKLQTQRDKLRIDGKNFNRDGLMVYVNGNECKYPFIDSDFIRISCAHESFPTLGIEYNATKLNLELVNITVSVDGQTTTKFVRIYDFVEIKVEKGSSYGYIAAITVGGLLGVGTVALIITVKYKRYIRLKKINENLKKVEREMMNANPNQTIIP